MRLRDIAAARHDHRIPHIYHTRTCPDLGHLAPSAVAITNAASLWFGLTPWPLSPP